MSGMSISGRCGDHRDRTDEKQPDQQEHEGQGDPDDEQDRGDDAANPSGFGVGAAGGIHDALVHCLEVVVAHDPREHAEDLANDQTENAEDKDRGAAVRFEGRGGLLHFPFLGWVCRRAVWVFFGESFGGRFGGAVTPQGHVVNLFLG